MTGSAKQSSAYSWSLPGKSAKRVFALDDPAIHVFVSRRKKQDVDHRDKRGDDSYDVEASGLLRRMRSSQ
jgi:hypothetical protein